VEGRVVTSVLFDVPGPRAQRRHRIIAVVTVLGLIALAAGIVAKLYLENQLTARQWEPFVTPRIVEAILRGVYDTLRAAVFAIAFAVVIGFVFGVAKLSNHRALRWPAWGVVEFFRAVPLLLLIVFLFTAYGRSLGSFWCLVIGLTLYNGAVLAEVLRAGVNAVPRGQAEAAYALGMRKTQVMTIILLPQAVKIMLPAIISQCIVALKDTSLGFVILAPSLTTVGRRIYGEFFNNLATALVLAAIYITLNLILSWLATKAQRRFTDGASVNIVGGQVTGAAT
jgi:glutamate transport system permease protein